MSMPSAVQSKSVLYFILNWFHLIISLLFLKRNVNDSILFTQSVSLVVGNIQMKLTAINHFVNQIAILIFVKANNLYIFLHFLYLLILAWS